ncbi:unnamed protein product [Colletotrichum noveboracense]|uniref:Uncharacterized protein n=1 Tax=Colletotrichum noveboracense TaxID=2664923 RepID=A0A9W4S468_9PEZI|nr:unnamed protein product [Colletotrichum noveboracense]
MPITSHQIAACRSAIDTYNFANKVIHIIITEKGWAAVAPVPNAVRGCLTLTTIISLHRREVAHAAVTSPPGSLRRAAQEAQIKHEKAAHNRALRQTRRTISFSCSFPFTNIPSLITDGFLKAKAIFSNKGDL